MKNYRPHCTSLIENDERGDRGSALLITLIFASIILYGLAGLIPLMLTDWKMNSRTSAQEAAFSLAESGVDEAAWAMLEFDDNDDDWTDAGWSESTNGAYWYREWDLSDISAETGGIYTLDEDRIGVFRVIVQKVESSTINIVSQGIVTGGKNVAKGFTVTRYIETQFRRPNPFGYGLIARDGFDFNGQPTFDSYDSRLFPYDYSLGMNSGSNVIVGSASLDVSKLDLGNAHIDGDLATGAADDGSDPLGGASMSGKVIWYFNMNFPEVIVPSTAGWNTSI